MNPTINIKKPTFFPNNLLVYDVSKAVAFETSRVYIVVYVF